MFQRTRLTLTAWYLAILMTISLVFSSAIYTIVTNEFSRFVEFRQKRILSFRQNTMGFVPPEIRQFVPAQEVEQVQNSDFKDRIILRLAFVNALILVVAGGLSYFLAGKTLRPIEETLRRQRQFISDASHEFKTPLANIALASEIFLRSHSNSLPEALDLIRENLNDVKRLQSLTTSMLDLAKLQTLTQIRQTFKPEPLQDILAAAEKTVNASAVQKQITINVRGSAEEIYVNCNRELLTRAFIAILDNAIKYSQPHMAITVTITKTTKYLRISFADQGIGIDKKDIPHIFTRFYRADSSRNFTGNHSYGLGLAIVKKIILLHDGHIKVESTVSQGTTFTITLGSGTTSKT